VKRMARVAGVRNADLITPHKLRHTFSINWVQHGGDIESLRRLLGHSSLSTTQIYLNFDFQYVRQLYDRLYAKPDERRLFS
jgi:site-specific recombinase XerC